MRVQSDKFQDMVRTIYNTVVYTFDLSHRSSAELDSHGSPSSHEIIIDGVETFENLLTWIHN